MLTDYSCASYSYFHYAYGFDTRRLAQVLDSLVRVSRRVGKSRFGKIIPESPLSFAGAIRREKTHLAFLKGKYHHTENCCAFTPHRFSKETFFFQISQLLSLPSQRFQVF